MAIHHSKDYTMGEEMTNSITHGVGWILAIAALVLLVVSSSINGDVWLIVACSIYGAGLVFLFAGSTLYHSIRSEGAKKVFKIIDHSAIFFLIAATYTPFTLTLLRGPLGWALFGIVWSGFVLGTLFKVFFAGRMKWLSVAIYVALGWCILVAIRPLVRILPLDGILFLLAGGIAYSLGAVIYSKKDVKYSHPVWHMYVLLGAFFHFCSILL